MVLVLVRALLNVAHLCLAGMRGGSSGSQQPVSFAIEDDKFSLQVVSDRCVHGTVRDEA